MLELAYREVYIINRDRGNLKRNRRPASTDRADLKPRLLQSHLRVVYTVSCMRDFEGKMPADPAGAGIQQAPLRHRQL